MKTCVLVVGLVCLAGAFLSVCSDVLADPQHGAEPASPTLPASLQQYYPPISPGPLYLLAMHRLSRPLSGMVADLSEGDIVNARKNYDAFRTLYAETADLIPEWKDRYPLEPLDHLGKVLKSGEAGLIMPAVETVGAVCHNCHLTFMPLVQQRYRWDSFSEITLHDPLSGRDVGLAPFMLMMETNFQGIAGNVAQGQPDNARAQYAGFSARFAVMADACTACHSTERTYFVDGQISARIQSLGLALEESVIDAGQVNALIDSIGQESCAKCHLVHIPAAYAQQVSRSGVR